MNIGEAKVIGLTGRMGSGKTAVAVKLAKQFVERGGVVSYYSLSSVPKAMLWMQICKTDNINLIDKLEIDYLELKKDLYEVLSPVPLYSFYSKFHLYDYKDYRTYIGGYTIGILLQNYGASLRRTFGTHFIPSVIVDEILEAGLLADEDPFRDHRVIIIDGIRYPEDAIVLKRELSASIIEVCRVGKVDDSRSEDHETEKNIEHIRPDWTVAPMIEDESSTTCDISDKTINLLINKIWQ